MENDFTPQRYGPAMSFEIMFTELVSETGLTATNYSDTALTAGTRYYYRVRATYGGVASAGTAAVSSVTSNPITEANVAISSVSTPSNGSGVNNFRITLPSSGLGQFYRVLATTDFGSWANESTITMGTGGLLQFDLPIPPGPLRRFYKVQVWRE